MMEKEQNMILSIADDIGEINSYEQLCTGAYYVSAFAAETGIPCEYYIVEYGSPVLSNEAKSIGVPLEHHPIYLSYQVDVPESGKMVVEYEIERYRKRNGIPAMADGDLLSIATFGREYHPGYFGDYPAPLITPRGITLRYVTLISGVFLIETDQLKKTVAVCYPLWDGELSDYTKSQSEQMEYDSRHGIHNTEGYLFFGEESACLAIFELWNHHRSITESENIDPAAVMNALWEYHTVYVAAHNIREQAGLNDVAGLFLRFLGFEDAELHGNAENLITLTQDAGKEYLLI